MKRKAPNNQQQGKKAGLTKKAHLDKPEEDSENEDEELNSELEDDSSAELSEEEYSENDDDDENVDFEDDDDDDDDESDDEEESVVKSGNKKELGDAVKALQKRVQNQNDKLQLSSQKSRTGGAIEAESDSEDEDDEADDDDEEDDDESGSDEAVSVQKSGSKNKVTAQSSTNKPLNKPSAVSHQSSEKASQTLFVRLPKREKFIGAKVEHFFRVRGIECSVRAIKGRNFGFVDLNDATMVSKAVKLNGQRLDGMELLVQVANKKPEDAVGDRPVLTKAEKNAKKEELRKEMSNRATLYVKDLPPDVTKTMIQEHFPQSVEVRLPKDDKGKLKGFAFVEFENEAIADKIMSKKQHSKISNQVITLDYVGSKSLNAKPSQPIIHDPSTTLFVKQLNYSTTEDGLKAICNNCIDVKIGTFPNTLKSRGFAFISYKTTEDAEADRGKLDGSQLDGRTIVVGFAMTPEQKSANKTKKKKTNKKKSPGDKKNNKSDSADDTSQPKGNKSQQKKNLKDKQKKKGADVTSVQEEVHTKKKMKMDIQSPKKRKENGSGSTPSKKKIKL